VHDPAADQRQDRFDPSIHGCRNSQAVVAEGSQVGVLVIVARRPGQRGRLVFVIARRDERAGVEKHSGDQRPVVCQPVGWIGSADLMERRQAGGAGQIRAHAARQQDAEHIGLIQQFSVAATEARRHPDAGVEQRCSS